MVSLTTTGTQWLKMASKSRFEDGVSPAARNIIILLIWVLASLKLLNWFLAAYVDARTERAKSSKSPSVPPRESEPEIRQTVPPKVQEPLPYLWTCPHYHWRPIRVQAGSFSWPGSSLNHVCSGHCLLDLSAHCGSWAVQSADSSRSVRHFPDHFLGWF
jgi:hypothetical protein